MKKVGDKVIFINDSNIKNKLLPKLEINKIYIIDKLIGKEFIKVEHNIDNFKINRFITLQEYRKQKLKNFLN
jgi:hypothetical protein